MPPIPPDQCSPYGGGGKSAAPKDRKALAKTVDDISRPRGPPNRKLLDRKALITKGVTYSREHLWKLVEAGRFPRPIKIGRLNFWIEGEVNKHIDRLVGERDARFEKA